MALPYPDKPAITDIVSTIISNIKDNSDDLDTRKKFKIVTFTKDLAVTGDVATTGVGFSPRTLIVFSHEPTSDSMSWGMYCFNALSYTSNCISRSYQPLSIAGFGNKYIVHHMVAFTKSATGKVASRDSDGFTLTWEHIMGSPTGTATIIAFCIR